MKLQSAILGATALVLAIGGGLYATGNLDPLIGKLKIQQGDAAAENDDPEILAPAVTVAKATRQNFVETVMVTGTLIPRDEILVAPEVEGLRVLDLRADVGDKVSAGQILATLVATTLEAQIAQNDASLARADASIARAQSAISESEARVTEANASLERARPLVKNRYLSESTFDQREAAAKMAQAQLVSARDNLKAAKAEKKQVVAQRKELDWRLSKTEVKAPEDGVVSRRAARVGGLALSAGEPMFRIIARGEVELEAEIPEAPLAKIRLGQEGKIDVAGVGTVTGSVRLISPEIAKQTRLGYVRVFLGSDPRLRIGAFGRGYIKTNNSNGLAVPASAVLYSDAGAAVQIVEQGKVVSKSVETGLLAKGMVEILSGIEAGDLVIARAGTFLREGDAVRPVISEANISSASPQESTDATQHARNTAR